MEELRIGNYVFNAEDEPYFFKVEEIKYKYGRLGVVYRDGSCWNSEPEFISLTEDILLKIKGVSKASKTCYELDESNVCFKIEDGNWDEPSLDILKGGVYITCVEYLHELQNVIYYLIREELEIGVEGFREYVCTDCGETSIKFDNRKITVGLCNYCEHPLWNSVDEVP